MDDDEILSGFAYGLWSLLSSIFTGLIIYGFVVLVACQVQG